MFFITMELSLLKYQLKIHKINTLEKYFNVLTNSQLKEKKKNFKLLRLLLYGKEKYYVLKEAFALIRETSRRILGLRHFDVQLIGGLVLTEGKIAEMKTGEGKTIVALLPTIFNSLD